MTLPDALIEQCRDVFDSEYRRLFPQGGDAGDHDEAVQAALAAVAELVQADQTRRIVEWLRLPATSWHDDGPPRTEGYEYAAAAERQFGVTQPEERAA